jgi:ornithine cyclodeaminase/alanine dehydrogenase
MPLLLNRDQVVSVLDMKDCIEAMNAAFTEMAEGSAVLPLRNNITPPKGLNLYMPAYLEKMNALACKVVSAYKANPTEHDLPTIMGTVLLQDSNTGQVVSIMDGGYLTAVRTGAVSGLATKHLARKDEGQVAGIFGAGIQAEMQLWAVAEAGNIGSAVVYDVLPDAAAAFAAKWSDKLDIPVEVADAPEAILETDVICTATTSATPLFDGAAVKPGTHINGIGSHSPGARELDTEIIKRSLLIADSREACLNEAGDVMIPISEGAITEDHIHAELAEIISGKKEGRTSTDQITLFKSNGLAIQDAAAAKVAYDRAREMGIGTEVEI